MIRTTITMRDLTNSSEAYAYLSSTLNELVAIKAELTDLEAKQLELSVQAAKLKKRQSKILERLATELLSDEYSPDVWEYLRTILD